MLESGPLREPALTALAPQDASCPLHACIASSTPYVEEREALTKTRSGLCKSPSLHVLLGIKIIILKKGIKNNCVLNYSKVHALVNFLLIPACNYLMHLGI